MRLAAGDRLGSYKILASLGAGAMGEVFCARDTRLGRDVAIKVLPERLAYNPEALERFEREARAVAALSHPNILAIHDFGREGSVAFAVMELLHGDSLDQRLAQERLSWRKALEIGAAIADGLASAHGRGIVHRDLKPANIFVTREGLIKILDFGLARRDATSSEEGTAAPTAAAQTEPGTMLGTVGYMSPEQVRGEPADARSDIFSLGCILYEMLTGRRAFHKTTRAESLAAILRDDPGELSESGRAHPPGLNGLIRRCLEKNPDERFQSARDLGYALRETLGASGVSLAPGVIPATSPRRSGAWIAAALLAAAFLAVFLLDLGGVRRRVFGAGPATLPTGWFKDGTHPQNYEMSIDTAMKHSGKAGAHIKSIGERVEGFGTLSQAFKADAYRGKRVRLSAWMKTKNAESAQLWMRVDGKRLVLGFDNMQYRPVKGTTEWKKYEITLDVPADALGIAFGSFVWGKGQAWVDDFQFEVVGEDVPSTDMLSQMTEMQAGGGMGYNLRAPVNLNFEG